MESQISSNMNVASAAQTVAPRGESESTSAKSTRMGDDLSTVAHGATDSMASGSVAATTRRFPLASGNVDKAGEDLWAAVCAGYKRQHDAKTPASFHTLSASEKRLIVKRAVDEVFKMDRLRIDGYFNRLTANEDVKPFLKGSISQATRDATEKLLEGDGGFYDKRVYLMKRIAKYEMIFTAETWEMENAKSDLWNEIRNGVNEKRHINVPESFLLLTYEDRRKVVKLTVDWTFRPVNEETGVWFDRFTENTVLQPYLKNTLPQKTYDEVVRLGALRSVRDDILKYEMLER